MPSKLEGSIVVFVCRVQSAEGEEGSETDKACGRRSAPEVRRQRWPQDKGGYHARGQFSSRRGPSVKGRRAASAVQFSPLRLFVFWASVILFKRWLDELTEGSEGTRPSVTQACVTRRIEEGTVTYQRK